MRKPPVALALAILAAGLVACGTTAPLVEQRQLLSGGAGTSGSTGGEAGQAVPGGTGSGPVGAGQGGAAGAGADTGGVAGPAAAGGPAGAGSVTGSAAAGHTSAAGTAPTTHGTKSDRSASSRVGAQPTSHGSGNSTASGASAQPIKLGVAYLDSASSAASAASFGVSAPNTLDAKSLFEGYATYFNAHGGIAGHQLALTEYSENANSSNLSGDSQAACAKFTQDAHVNVVMDNAFGSKGPLQSCLQSAGVQNFDLYGEPDAAALAKLTYNVTTIGPAPDRGYATVLSDLARTGYVKAANRIGILYDCAAYANALHNTVLPLAKQLGLNVVDTRSVTCSNGSGDTGTDSAQVTNAMLSFSSEMVDRVMLMSQQEGAGFLLASEAADAQEYHPGWMLSDTASAASLLGSIPAGQRPQVHGSGFVPVADVSTYDVPPTAAESRCSAMAKAQGLNPTNSADQAVVYFICAPFLLLEKALMADRGNVSAAAIANAISGFGTSFSDPGVLGDGSSFSTTRRDGPDTHQTFGYEGSCSCLRYNGSPQTDP